MQLQQTLDKTKNQDQGSCENAQLIKVLYRLVLRRLDMLRNIVTEIVLSTILATLSFIFIVVQLRLPLDTGKRMETILSLASSNSNNFDLAECRTKTVNQR